MDHQISELTYFSYFLLVVRAKYIFGGIRGLKVHLGDLQKHVVVVFMLFFMLLLFFVFVFMTGYWQSRCKGNRKASDSL